MNKPLSDAELQHRMMKYNAEVVDRIVGLFTPPPRRMGEADDTHRARTEADMQAQFFPAYSQFRSLVQDLAASGGVMADHFQYLLRAMSDHAPTRELWAEQIDKQVSA